MNPQAPDSGQPPTLPTANRQPPTNGSAASDPAKSVIKLFPRWLVIVFGVAGFVLAVSLLLWSVLAPERFDGAFARTILAIFFAFVGGLFLFILYPWHYRLTKIPFAELSLELVGPSALFVALVVFIRSILPTPADWQVYDLRTEDGAEIGQIPDLSVVGLTYTDGSDSHEFQLVQKPGSRVLQGIRIHFPENSSKRTASIHLSNYLKDQPVVFERYGTRLIKVKLEVK